MAQAHALKFDISGQLETFERTETWDFRYGGVMVFNMHIRRLSLAILLLLEL
jgi:hypothetical protein